MEIPKEYTASNLLKMVYLRKLANKGSVEAQQELQKLFADLVETNKENETQIIIYDSLMDMIRNGKMKTSPDLFRIFRSFEEKNKVFLIHRRFNLTGA
jgi:archaellum biogenesis ATPase FlaH